MSLSYWFRDYVYIPLGGNRGSFLKHIRNIFIVWFLTGFWHGASWNFIIWGLYFGIILVIEKLFLKKFLDKIKGFSHIYTLFIVIISFMIFNAPSLNSIITELKSMFFISDIPLYTKETIYLLKNYLVLIVVGIIASTPLFKNVINKMTNTKLKYIIDILEPVFYILLLVICTSFLIDESYNPFLYFRF